MVATMHSDHLKSQTLTVTNILKLHFFQYSYSFMRRASAVVFVMAAAINEMQLFAIETTGIAALVLQVFSLT